MPAVPLHPLVRNRACDNVGGNPLPSLLHTPAGLAMLELQGTISTEQQEFAEALHLGRLVFPPADDDDEHGPWDGKRVLLYVGDHQRLSGEVKKLSNPIAMLRRRADASVEDEVEIAEVVYWKLLFSHRPEPLGGLQQDQLEET